MQPISILLAEDHMVVRQGLRALLEAEGDFKVVAEARTGREAVELARKVRPAVVVMDVAMPILNGIEATRQILKAFPATRVLILSAYGDDAYVERAIGAGAAGYLLKQSSLAALAHAIRQVQGGFAFFSPNLSKHMLASRRMPPGRKASPQKQLIHLTPREIEVLQLVAEGGTNKQISADLNIAIKTVEKHRHQIMEKLQIRHTAGLTRYALAAGIIETSAHVTIL